MDDATDDFIGTVHGRLTVIEKPTKKEKVAVRYTNVFVLALNTILFMRLRVI